MLLEVYIFFMLYFYAAQSIFVRQFFNSLLLSELYLWKKDDSNNYNLKEIIKHALFSIPNQLISEENPRITLGADELIYEENSETDGIYYIVDGQVITYKENYMGHMVKGEFFGDLDCILEQRRTFSAKTTVPTTLIFINKTEFAKVIENDPEVSQKMIDSVPEYVHCVYGRK